MPGTAADPVKLDPFQRIVEVGWPAANYLVVEFNLKSEYETGSAIGATIKGAGYTENLDQHIKVVKPSAEVLPSVVNPVSKDMGINFLFWSVAPILDYKTETTTGTIGGGKTVTVTQHPQNPWEMVTEFVDFPFSFPKLPFGASAAEIFASEKPWRDAKAAMYDFAAQKHAITDAAILAVDAAAAAMQPLTVQAWLVAPNNISVLTVNNGSTTAGYYRAYYVVYTITVAVVDDPGQPSTITTHDNELKALVIFNLKQLRKYLNAEKDGDFEFEIRIGVMPESAFAQATINVYSFRNRKNYAVNSDNKLIDNTTKNVGQDWASLLLGAEDAANAVMRGKVNYKTLEVTATGSQSIPPLG